MASIWPQDGPNSLPREVQETPKRGKNLKKAMKKPRLKTKLGNVSVSEPLGPHFRGPRAPKRGPRPFQERPQSFQEASKSGFQKLLYFLKVFGRFLMVFQYILTLFRYL